TVGPLTNGTASLNASRNKLHSNYDSVQEQTGLFAGKGGYQVNVGDHTQLDGAVIASQADKTKNTLNTGTLGFKDIKNQADFTVEQQSAGVSLGQPTAGQVLNNLAVNGLTGTHNSGHDSSTTHAAVSDGNLIIRDKAHQTQDVATLSRDTDNAANVLSPIFDKEKEQQRLKQAQLIGEISAQMTEIASTEGKIIATKAAKAKLDHISEPDKAAARKKLVDSGNPHPTAADINKQVYDTAYTQALNDSGFGTGGTYQKALQAATAAIQGLAGNNLGQALAGGASPYLAGVIKALTTDPQTHQVDIATNTLAHAILGAVAAEVSGNNALAGAAGAASGELAAQVLIKQLYGDGAKVSELTEEQKQTISTLSTLAAGLAGGIAGDSTGSTVTGALAGKNAVENNFLSADQIDDFTARAKGCEGRGDCKQITKEMEDLSLKQQKELIAVCSSNPAACKEKYGDIPANGMLVRQAIDRVLGDDVPSRMKNDMSSLLAQQIEAEGVVSSTEFANQLQSRYGIDKQQAEILAGAALGAVTGGLGKGKSGNSANNTNSGATLPMGGKQKQMNQPKNPSYQPVRNEPATINNREYSGHALDRMQDRGITPSVVENTIKNGISTPSRGGTTVHYDPMNNVSIVTNESGKVVTVKYGK
ncbi:VENN motif pre-toxin domain-containing protein, partial [Photorhabdus caribbeanensis]|uniref:VENN motif pre-toxin domain-containing protein n=1 Tax=Photorhabdus caribbeanensis TaxID=1004165 RepID=UPI001BD57CF2